MELAFETTLDLILCQHPHLEDTDRLDRSPAVEPLAAILAVSARDRGENARAMTTVGGELIVVLTSDIGGTPQGHDVMLFPDVGGNLHAVRCDDTAQHELAPFDAANPDEVSAAIDDVLDALCGE